MSVSAPQAGDVPVALACWDYDRTRALQLGAVRPEGVRLTYLPLPVEETFFRMLRFGEFDAAEMSLSSYVLTLRQPEPPLIAIPVFPSRAFRHSCIFVRADSDLNHPRQLAGRRVGVPEYQMTAAVWIRGILDEHYELPFASVTYVTGGLEQPGRSEKLALELPDDVRIERLPAGGTLSEQLLAGEIDALYTARTPSAFHRPERPLRRLFADAPGEEERYFGDTGIFPIMHTVVLRRELYERHRWLARSLQRAFAEAQAAIAGDLSETAALKYSLPWLVAAVEHQRAVMGDDAWPYGLERNRHTLNTFLRYSAAQGLAAPGLAVEELFAPETLEEHVI